MWLEKRILFKASGTSFGRGGQRPSCTGRTLNARIMRSILWVRTWSQEGIGWDQCFRKCWCQGWVERPEILAIYKASSHMSHLILSWQMVSLEALRAWCRATFRSLHRLELQQFLKVNYRRQNGQINKAEWNIWKQIQIFTFIFVYGFKILSSCIVNQWRKENNLINSFKTIWLMT